MGRVRVKVCCISSLEEAAVAIAAGADALGLVGEMPSGPGVISESVAREIAAAVPPTVDTFLLTSSTTAEEIIEQVQVTRVNTVQVVRHIDPSVHEALAKALPGVRRVQVVHVEDAGSLDLIAPYEAHVHAFLLDSGRPTAAVPELGGTGRSHDWRISAAFVERSSRPVFLAGGLRPDNVAEAVSRVQPFGLDVCSGVRRDDQLNPQLLNRFMNGVWQRPDA